MLHEERFVDLPPAQVWAQLLDAGQVLPCSIRTMYRVLAANAEVRERRNQLRHPAYRKPELMRRTSYRPSESGGSRPSRARTWRA
jgi:putative transposase